MAAATMRQEAGNRYGRLIVLGEAGRRGKRRFVRCRCDCGTEKEIHLDSLRTGKTQSCGCLNRERTRAKATRHGGCGTPTYGIWRGMNNRCRNPRNSNYRYYGARGLTVCSEWATSFETFLADVGPRPSPQHTLERVDGDRGYSPDNVVWATPKERNRNCRGLHLIPYRGKTLCMAAWAEEIGISRSVLERRLARGWTIHRAFTQPVKHPN